MIEDNPTKSFGGVCSRARASCDGRRRCPRPAGSITSCGGGARYDRVLAEDYGDSVLACFTDEPHAGAWSSDFAEVFVEDRRSSSAMLDDGRPEIIKDHQGVCGGEKG